MSVPIWHTHPFLSSAVFKQFSFFHLPGYTETLYTFITWFTTFQRIEAVTADFLWLSCRNDIPCFDT